MAPAGVAFDLDGTLIDSEPVHERLYREKAREFGWSLTDEEYDRYLRGRTDREVFNVIIAQTGAGESAGDLVRQKQRTYRDYLVSGMVGAIAGAKEFVTKLHSQGIPLALATSATREESHLSLAAIGLDGCFLEIITAEDVQRGKPDPEIFRTASARLGIPMDRCVAYEDSEAGVRAARAAGMFVVGVSRGSMSRLLCAGAQHVIADFVGHVVPEPGEDGAPSVGTWCKGEAVVRPASQSSLKSC